MGVLRRKSPLFRRKSNRNVSAIEVEVEDVIQRSPFLQADAQQMGPQHASASSGAPPLPLATFQRKEFQVGSLLGTGSFSSVHAIIGYKLASNSSSSSKKSKQHQRTSSSSSLLDVSFSVSASLSSTSSSTASTSLQDSRVALSQTAFDTAGTARYAVKFVKKELTKKPHAFRGAAVDLIVEAKYLAALDHRNIIKLRGLAVGGSTGFLDGHDGFFLIVDRLQETLGDRIESWKQLPLDGSDAQQQQQQQRHDLLTLQTDYASQIGEALAYLHDRRILFRDLKPSNVGFRPEDPHTVQLFDFGLCRELPEDSNDDDDDSMVFRMSGAGTYLYMAAEVINQKRYNLKCDVYSWAFMFHEMIALERPFDHYSVSEHKEFVCEIGQRPSVEDYNLPLALQTLLRQAWEQDPKMRLTMRQACNKLQPILRDFQLQQQQAMVEEHAKGAACSSMGHVMDMSREVVVG